VEALEKARGLIQARLAELESEAASLEKALVQLDGGAPRKRRGGRPKAKGKRRRSRKGGTRGEQAVKLIQAEPGLSAAQVAERLNIQPNYMYRVLSDETKRGAIKKKGRTYIPA
jgi:predicted HTH transcriptional regulator